MSNNGTTSIDDLPVSKNIDENVRLDVKEKNVVINDKIGNENFKRDINFQEEQQSFLKEIQKVSSSGILQLPSRDIPQSQNHITQDIQTSANYVPKDTNDYIKIHQTPEDIIQRNAQREKNDTTIDDYYNEFQIPIIIGVLYILFHLPIVRSMMFLYIPRLFHKDGNLNGVGYLANSILFSGLCYFVMKSINFLSI